MATEIVKFEHFEGVTALKKKGKDFSLPENDRSLSFTLVKSWRRPWHPSL